MNVSSCYSGKYLKAFSIEGCGLLLVHQTGLFKALKIPAQSLSLFSGYQEDYWLNGSSIQEKLPCFFYPS